MSEIGIIPAAPFIPERPQPVIERRIIEWESRADLAEHAFDGQWRVLCSYPQFDCDLLERWFERDGWLWLQHWVKRR